jgi:hypothetical protein
LKEGLKLGFTGGLTYRNTQETNPFETVRNSNLTFAGKGDPIDTAAIKKLGQLI